LREKYSLSFWDSILVASASEAGCNLLVSEDMQDGKIINKVVIKNIFRESLKTSVFRDSPLKTTVSQAVRPRN
jgi:predicted nucleic acid-binding protein